MRFAVLLLLAALLAPEHSSAQPRRLYDVPVVDPLELPRQRAAPADDPAPASADVDT